jgi:GNAT superfamily N-acetyltransferase
VELRSLVEEDDRQGFSCGDAQLDDFFRARAGQSQFKHRASATYVLASPGVIAAFVTVVPGTARRDELGPTFQRLPPSPLPVLVLARMGVSTAHQRTGLGERLLGKVVSLALGLSRDVGCVGVVVDAKVAARGFYERFDFTWLPDQPRADLVRGFLSIRTIEAASRPVSGV